MSLVVGRTVESSGLQELIRQLRASARPATRPRRSPAERRAGVRESLSKPPHRHSAEPFLHLPPPRTLRHWSTTRGEDIDGRRGPATPLEDDLSPPRVASDGVPRGTCHVTDYTSDSANRPHTRDPPLARAASLERCLRVQVHTRPSLACRRLLCRHASRQVKHDDLSSTPHPLCSHAPGVTEKSGKGGSWVRRAQPAAKPARLLLSASPHRRHASPHFLPNSGTFSLRAYL